MLFARRTPGGCMRLSACSPLRLPGARSHIRAAVSVAATAQQLQHVTIVGGGAAGLTAALFAAREGAKVTVLERTTKCGTKILMSGGTRCNVLPVDVDLQRDFFTGGSASAMRAVFASWTLPECKAWLEDAEEGLGLPLQVEPETLKYFPTSNSSKEVRDRLVAACSELGVAFRYNSSVEGIRRVARDASGPAAAGAAQPPPAAKRGDGRSGREAQQQQRSQQRSSGRPAGAPGSGQQAEASTSEHGAGAPDDTWVCDLADGSQHQSGRLVITTGGLSFPGVGTDGTGHRIIRRLGHEVRETYPALTPLTGQHPAGTNLAGLSLYDAQVSFQGAGSKRAAKAARSDMLFTHKGFSGPAVLDVSHHAIRALQQHARAGAAAAAGGAAAAAEPPHLSVSWTGEPAAEWDARLRAGGLPLVATLLRRHGVRERLADALCAELGLADRKLSQLRGTERAALVAALTKYPLRITGSEGYKKAEVTGGGVPLEQINCGTMESRLLPGLHMAGEILDVFGRIGGFNFYWAWVSGRLAGLGAALGSDEVAISKALQRQRQLWVQWRDDEW